MIRVRGIAGTLCFEDVLMRAGRPANLLHNIRSGPWFPEENREKTSGKKIYLSDDLGLFVRGGCLALFGQGLGALAQPGLVSANYDNHDYREHRQVDREREPPHQLGDTVQWDNVEGFHNVESCDGVSDPDECSGQAVEGSFGFGAFFASG